MVEVPESTFSSDGKARMIFAILSREQDEWNCNLRALILIHTNILAVSLGDDHQSLHSNGLYWDITKILRPIYHTNNYQAYAQHLHSIQHKKVLKCTSFWLIPSSIFIRFWCSSCHCCVRQTLLASTIADLTILLFFKRKHFGVQLKSPKIIV